VERKGRACGMSQWERLFQHWAPQVRRSAGMSLPMARLAPCLELAKADMWLEKMMQRSIHDKC
jgi:hypothetical protein